VLGQNGNGLEWLKQQFQHLESLREHCKLPAVTRRRYIYIFMYFYFMQSKSEKRASPKTQDGVCIFVLKTCGDKSDLHLSALKSGGQSSLFPTVKLMQQKSSIFSNQTASEEIGSNAVSHLIIVIINVRTIALEIYNYHDL